MADRAFDVLVVGGGIMGAFVAWDGALRGFDVALVERGDYGAATSAASGKLIHGGIRYLQQGQVRRVRRSRRERLAFLTIAPHHLVSVPFLVPTYGWGTHSTPALAAAMGLYEATALGLGEAAHRQVLGRPRHLTRAAAARRAPLLAQGGRPFRGAFMYPELVMANPERLVLDVLWSARELGARTLNGVTALEVLRRRRGVEGLRCRDEVGGGEVVLRGRHIVNCAGPWIAGLEGLDLPRPLANLAFARGAHVLLPLVDAETALVVTSPHRHEDALVRGGHRHFFLVPWSGLTLAGTTYGPHDPTLPADAPTTAEAESFLRDLGAALPGLDLRLKDLRYGYAGLYPEPEGLAATGGYRGGRESLVVDHAAAGGPRGLYSVVLAKFTAAREMAQEVVDRLVAAEGRAAPCATAATPLRSSRYARADALAADLLRRAPRGTPRPCIERLVGMYGSVAVEVVDRARDTGLAPAAEWGDLALLAAEFAHALACEQARGLEDLLVRRTGLASRGRPPRHAVELAVETCRHMLGWTSEVERSQRLAFEAFLCRHLAGPDPAPSGNDEKPSPCSPTATLQHCAP